MFKPKFIINFSYALSRHREEFVFMRFILEKGMINTFLLN